MITSERMQAIVTETIRPHQAGRVRFQGSWWSASCKQEITLAVGEVVDVVGRDNITLVVEPALVNDSNFKRI